MFDVVCYKMWCTYDTRQVPLKHYVVIDQLLHKQMQGALIKTSRCAAVVQTRPIGAVNK